MAHIELVTRPNIAELRALIGQTEGRAQVQRIASPDLPMGIPRSSISEIFGLHGSGKTEWCLKLLAKNAHFQVAWIEPTFTSLPTAFLQRDVALDRILFIEAGEHSFWCLRELIQTKLFDIVVASHMNFHEKQLRALQLCCERSNSALIFLNEEPQSAWPIAMQIEVTCLKDDQLRVELRRLRGAVL